MASKAEKSTKSAVSGATEKSGATAKSGASEKSGASGASESGASGASAASSSEASGSEVSGSSASGASKSGASESGASSAASGASEASKTEASKTEASKTEASKTEASKTAASKTAGKGGPKSAGAGTKSAGGKSAGGGVKSAKKEEADAEVFSTRIPNMNMDVKSVGKAGPGLSPDAADKLAKQAKEKAEKEQIQDSKGPKTGRKLYIMRHAERMDRIFPGWTRLAFTDLGKYRPYDLNQPLTLPKRSGGPAHFHNDTPITEMGYVSSQMIGRGMRLNKVHVTRIYCSPALRCIQTAYGLMKTLNAPCKICIEPGLFEWCAWYEAPPIWMSPDEMTEAGYQIDASYKPFLEVQELFKLYLKETSMEHFERYHKVLMHILNTNPDKGAMLVVGHGTSLDGCRKLLGKQMEPLSRAEMDRMGLHYPYCSVVAMEELGNKTWRVIHNPIPSITYLDFSNRLNFQFFNR